MMITHKFKNKNLYELKIDKFLGLNTQSSKSNCSVIGDAESTYNFKITDDYSIVKRKGIDYQASVGSKAFSSYWYGDLTQNGTELLYVYSEGYLYSYNPVTKEVKNLGFTVSSSEGCLICANKKLYIVNGKEYFVYNGSSISTVSGYVPVLCTNTKPDLSNYKMKEPPNALTNIMNIEYTGDGESNVYRLPYTYLASISAIKVNGGGVPTSAYTTNLTAGTITFLTAPPSNSLVEVKFVLNKYFNRSLVYGCTKGMYFGSSDKQDLFLWGNSSDPSLRINTFASNPEYFPYESAINIGSGAYAITDIVSHGDKQIIFTTHDIHYSQTKQKQFMPYYPVYQLNGFKGNKVKKGVQNINNELLFISDGVWTICETNVHNKHKMKFYAPKIKDYIIDFVKNAVCTYNYSAQNYYIISDGVDCLIHNYKSNVWFLYKNIPARIFFEIKNTLYFCDSEGSVFLFESGNYDDRLKTGFSKIGAQYKLNKLYFGSEFKYKSANYVLINHGEGQDTNFIVKAENENGKLNEFNIYFNNEVFTNKMILNNDKFLYLSLTLSCNAATNGAHIYSMCIPYYKQEIKG